MLTQCNSKWLSHSVMWMLALVLLVCSVQPVAATPGETDHWFPVGPVTAEISARYRHTAVWTGSKMIIWGGDDGRQALNTGGIYDPATDTWTALPTDGAPDARSDHTAVWTGSKMIIWGGDDGDMNLNTGGVYDLAANTWTALSTIDAPDAREHHTAVWTGSKMVVWGGSIWDGFTYSYFNTGGVYDPDAKPGQNAWTAISTYNAPSARRDHTAVWTGSKMIIWGGDLNPGGIYDPIKNQWTSVSTTGAPAVRDAHTAVWTGSKMVVWGGHDGTGFINTGGIYDPDKNEWTSVSTTGAPAARGYHIAVWTGSEMVVWGGVTGGIIADTGRTGGRYNPGKNTWVATTTTGAPSARYFHTVVWTGNEMIVWGGYDGSMISDTGGRYAIPYSVYLPVLVK